MTTRTSWIRSAKSTLAGVALTTLAASLLVAIPAEAKSRKKHKENASPVEEVVEPARDSSLVNGGDGSTAASAGQRTVSLTFKQLGAWSSLKLRGVDGSQSIGFTLRADEVVVGAKLRLAYDYSPALLPDLSHLRVLLNERVVSVENLPQGKNVGNLREIPLDPRLFNEFNELRFNLVGHYTRQCEDPWHTSLWLTLSDLGRIELTLAPVSTNSDLKNLPAPFLDTRDITALKLPFVFVQDPQPGPIRAAGIVASWFGIQAGSKGAQFPVNLNKLPDGNAVVFLQGNDSFAGLKPAKGATLSVHPHPTNPLAKLLLVAGNNEEDILRAARALALVSPTLIGQSVTVTKESDAPARKPYDAPAWIPVDRPVRIGELSRPSDLRVQGFYPGVIRVNYRVPPDVFTWRTPGAPLKLKYRATRLPEQRNSTLAVSLNQTYIDTLAINGPNKGQGANGLDRIVPVKAENNSVRDASLYLPPYELGGRDQLQFAYTFDLIKEGECKNLPPDNMQGAIDAESTIDFSSFPKYAVLPNLGYFANVGYPFTRMADLSETAVVLSERPTAEELGLYMTVMGRMGEATGYPAIRHALLRPNAVDAAGDKDIIVIGASNSQTLMAKWAEKLPFVQIDGERRVRAPSKSWFPSYRWRQNDERAESGGAGSMSLVSNGNLSAVFGFESPLKSSRSVVFLYADRPADLRKISDALLDPERIGQIQGDLAIVDDKSVANARVAEPYVLGSLPAFAMIRWFLADHPLLFAFTALLSCLVVATVAYRALRRVASRRKKINLT
ncbi:cellulose biosynthesis cyclic di-GMP-binding regulatory protein BcsB [Noviherbaspirillum galbum]|uniref:Cyclic di-GMP-binding protein n=1 Tax=Noviherbaspirillum galbum TaxID=2709383 RepID=A0A6B3SQT9_9BURK|nr:cellulose biosynthesis cyclic di-GMP-binding regulatory protein BcsB [Noviherbaspirillum galbum]NEX60029.1 cellulose biosynthesis cyclic di-GMP-binding regulatory protein BcsB [Noviherbaspirillum galbum]